MTAFMEEMKQQSQSKLENLRKGGQPRQEVAFKPERQCSNELGGSILITYGELVHFTTYLCWQRLDTDESQTHLFLIHFSGIILEVYDSF